MKLLQRDSIANDDDDNETTTTTTPATNDNMIDDSGVGVGVNNENNVSSSSAPRPSNKRMAVRRAVLPANYSRITIRNDGEKLLSVI